jgi:hypothetical protein
MLMGRCLNAVPPFLPAHGTATAFVQNRIPENRIGVMQTIWHGTYGSR